MTIIQTFAHLLFGYSLTPLGLLIGFILEDLLTHLLVRIDKGSFSRYYAKKMLLQKLTIFIVISVAHGIDYLFGQNNLLRETTVYFYIANEGLLILEHATQLHVLVPTKLKEIIQQILQQQEDK